MSPGGSSTVHIYTQAIHRTTQNKQYIEQQKNFGRVRAVPCLGELYPGIYITTEEKARKNLRQGSRILGIQENKIFDKQISPHLMYVCPCIIYEIDERYPLDATIYLLL